LHALKDLKLSVVPILETHGDSKAVVVYNAANGESIVKAKLLALLGTSDTRSYSPGDKLIFENGNPCLPIGKTLTCERSKMEFKNPILHSPAVVGTLLGYNPEAVKQYALRECMRRKRARDLCEDEFENERRLFETLMDPSSAEHEALLKTLHWYLGEG
jgi:hypothetical protein